MNRYEFLIRFSMIRGQKLKKFQQGLLPYDDNIDERRLLVKFALNEQQIKQFYHHDVAKILNWLEQDNHFLISYHDKHYPILLKQISHPPLILFVVGDVNLLNSPQIAMVGSRQFSDYGAQWARYFAGELAQNGLTITSGLALGIDAICHRGALNVAGKTIAVLGSGLNQISPKTNRRLVYDILANNGTIISEFYPDQIARPEYFPRRNRIISGLSLGTLIVEASAKSGSLITARYALEQNRDVFALPGDIANPNSQGTHWLIKQGAYLVTEPADIIAHYSHSLTWLNQQVKSSVTDLTTPHPEIFALISRQATAIDVIANKIGLPVAEVTIKLMELELAGTIAMVNGGYIRN